MLNRLLRNHAKKGAPEFLHVVLVAFQVLALCTRRGAVRQTS